MKGKPNKSILDGGQIILFQLGNLKKSESLCIISDTTTKDLGEIFEYIAKQKKIKTEHKVIKPLVNHGEPLPNHLGESMKRAELTIGITDMSIAHSPQRIKAELSGKRFLSLPNYSLDILKHPAIRTNYKILAKKVKKISKILTDAKSICIKTDIGTNLNLDISRRESNFAPGFVNEKILLGSPPDIETNIAPLETKSNGKIVVDGSITHKKIGKLDQPISLTIKNGKIINFDGDIKLIKILERIFGKDSKNKILGEFGIGFNDKAKLCGTMLLDEGCFGTFHFGFGSNILLGGQNRTNFHLDFVIQAHRLLVDEKMINLKQD